MGPLKRTTAMSASLLSPPLLRGEGLPDFPAITPEQVRQQIPLLLQELNAGLSDLEDGLNLTLGSSEPLGWSQVMDPLQRLGERLRWSWGVVSHLNGVCNSPELREAHRSQQGAVVAFGNRVGQSRSIYHALKRLQEQHRAGSLPLDPTQERILEAELLDMQLRGVALEGEAQAAFNTASEELAELATRFGNHVLDATNGWSLALNSTEEVDGLPESLRQLLAQAARDAGLKAADGSEPSAEKGPWLLGLDMPRAMPFLKYSRRRDLRERLYKAQVSRASSGDLDNSPLIERILTLKREQAARLGYATWAEVSLASKMADSVDAVERLLEDLRAAAYPAAQRELKALAACCAARSCLISTAKALRPWFPLPRVLDGLFGLCERLFSIRMEAADGEAPIWHPDVRFFRVNDAGTTRRSPPFTSIPTAGPAANGAGPGWMNAWCGRCDRMAPPCCRWPI
jgi:oligopeptidase A